MRKRPLNDPSCDLVREFRKDNCEVFARENENVILISQEALVLIFVAVIHVVPYFEINITQHDKVTEPTLFGGGRIF